MTMKTTKKASQEHYTFLCTVLPHVHELTDTTRLWAIARHVLTFPQIEALICLSNPAHSKYYCERPDSDVICIAASEVLSCQYHHCVAIEFANILLDSEVSNWVDAQWKCSPIVLAWFSYVAFGFGEGLFNRSPETREKVLNLMRALVWPILRDLKDPRYGAQS